MVIDVLSTMSSPQPENNRNEKTQEIIIYNQERKQLIDSDSMSSEILDFVDKYKILVLVKMVTYEWSSESLYSFLTVSVTNYSKFGNLKQYKFISS